MRANRPPILDVRLVQIVDAQGNSATVVDQLGKTMSLRVDVVRVSGKIPKQGERWIIDRSLGDWTFAAFIGEPTDIKGGGGDDMLTLMLMGG